MSLSTVSSFYISIELKDFYQVIYSFIGFNFVLQDKAYNKDDDVIKATSFEVISTLRDVLKTSSLWRDHVQTYTKVWTLLYMCLL